MLILSFWNQNIFLLQQLIICLVLIVLVLNLVYFFGERRIMVFFIYLEVVHVLLILFLLTSTWNVDLLPVYLIFSLFIIGVSGAETAVLLVLFIIYFRVTGLTKFELYTGIRR